MDKDTIHQTNVYILLFLSSNNLYIDRHIYSPTIFVKTMKADLELMVKAKMVNLWIKGNRVSYYYVKPDETQIDLLGAPKKNYDSQ